MIVAPHTEAISLIGALPAAGWEEYQAMPREQRQGTFAVENADGQTAVECRAVIVEKFSGATFDEALRALTKLLLPWHASPAEAKRAANTCLLHWCGVGYSAARYRPAAESAWLFPWWQFMSMGYGVRPAHAALCGKVFPAGSPVWDGRLPPWDKDCRCLWRELSEFDIEEITREDAAAPAERRRIVPAEFLILTEIEAWLWASIRRREYANGVPVKEEWEPAQWHDIRTPAQRSDPWAGWNPAALTARG